MNRRTFELVPVDAQAFRDAHTLAQPGCRLRDLLSAHPAFSLTPLTEAHLELPVDSAIIEVVEATPGTPLYLPPGLSAAGLRASGEPGDDASKPAPATDVPEPAPARPAGRDHPESLKDREAVLLAHDGEIDQAAAYLASGLSVLVSCEKLLVEHLAAEIAGRSGRAKRTVRIAAGASGPALGGLGGGRRSELVTALQTAVLEAADGEVVIVPHLDLLAGGTDAGLTGEARELTDVLYERSGCVLLAFVDPSLVLPTVLANRFAARRAIDILPREIVATDGSRVPIGRALVTREEADLFAGFDPVNLYKHVAGMNAVRLRHALRFALHTHRDRGAGPTFEDLLRELREFKANTSTDSFEIPNTTFDEIGGYTDVKEELRKAITIIQGAADIPERLRPHLVPKGFIFHGPPGTGKTLFAKAIATQLGGTILVVSGPEITDKYVGESERKVRDLFAQARRNAPSVVVFDEFDSIAAQRTGRDDGGSRAGNAIVAQLLTELDGFRAEVPVLIIGTTNRLDLIDEALLRPSRFRAIGIDLPDEEARYEIANFHAHYYDYTLSDTLLREIARATRGMNGDEIGSVFRDARADELVGSRTEAGPRRFGALIGALRMAHRKRDLERLRRGGLTRPPEPELRQGWSDLTDERDTDEPAADHSAADHGAADHSAAPATGTGGAR
jgi:transitional endoplasmic reticulum ATPase